MKRLSTVLAAILLMFSGFAAYASEDDSSLPARFDAIAEKAQSQYKSLSEEQWKAMNREFDTLCDQFRKEKKNLTSDERSSINDAIGRYHAAAVKSGYNEVAEGVNDIIKNKIPDLWKETTSGISSFFKGLGKKKK